MANVNHRIVRVAVAINFWAIGIAIYFVAEGTHFFEASASSRMYRAANIDSVSRSPATDPTPGAVATCARIAGKEIRRCGSTVGAVLFVLASANVLLLRRLSKPDGAARNATQSGGRAAPADAAGSASDATGSHQP